MKTLFALLALFFCGTESFGAAGPAAEYLDMGVVRVRAGDDLQWARPSLDDANWEAMEWWRVDPQGRLLWVRAHIDLPPGFDTATEPFGIFISGAASYEVFWNGVRVGRNGVPGETKQAEQPGLIDAAFFVPRDLLRAGDNVLALRMSSFHLRRPLSAPMQRIVLMRHGEPPRVHALRVYLPTLCAMGALLLGSVYFAAMYLSNRRDISSLLLAALSLSVLLQSMTETSRLILAYAYPWHLLRLELILGFAALSSLLLVAYVAYRYARQRVAQLVALAAISIAGCIWFGPGFDAKTTLLVLAALVVSFLTSLVVGIKDRQPGAASAALALGAVVALAVSEISSFIDQTYYVAMTGLLLFLFAQQVHSLRRAERERERAELRAARMELELLKKQIQPHFLMNSLTAITELLESEPSTCIEMIEALAGELRAISAMSGATTVPLRQELELCRYHLKVMSFRRGMRFELNSSAVNLNAAVPPGVFHTLIENALTHNQYTDSTVLELQAIEDENGKRIYRLRTPLKGNRDKERSSGTGHAYVCARLKEAFGKNWLFRSAACEGEWLDEIEIGL